MVLSALEPAEMAALLIGLLGLIPVVTYYRPRAKLLTAGYAILVANLVLTNLENLFLGDLFNGLEHVSLVGSGIAFCGAAYVQRKRLLGDAGGQ